MTSSAPFRFNLPSPDLPTGWRITRLKHVANLQTGLALGQRYGNEELREYPYLRVANVQDGRLVLDDVQTVMVPRSQASSCMLRSGDVLMNEGGDADKLGRGCVWHEEIPNCLHQNHVFSVRPHAVQSAWLSLWTSSPFAKAYFESHCKQSTNLASISARNVLELPVVVPPSRVQDKILAAVDRRLGELDGLVTAKERILQLLVEKRRAIIAHAVLRGIDSNVAVLDSGVSWLGQIPAHWKVCRCAWLFRERDDRAAPELPLLEVSINSGVTLRQFSTDQIESTAADFNSYKVARARDLAFNKMRMWQGAVGIAPVDGLVSPDYTVAEVSKDLSTGFISYLMRTEQFSAECCRESHGITWDRLRLYWDGFREIRIPVPPLDEQERIVAWIDQSVGRADTLRVMTARTIELLKERRSALIAAAVTGQLDLGGALAR